MRIVLCLLLSLSSLSAMPDKKPIKERVHKKHKQLSKPGHRKVVHTHVYEEDYSQEDASKAGKKVSKAKKAGRVIAAILTFGISLLIGRCG